MNLSNCFLSSMLFYILYYPIIAKSSQFFFFFFSFSNITYCDLSPCTFPPWFANSLQLMFPAICMLMYVLPRPLIIGV